MTQTALNFDRPAQHVNVTEMEALVLNALRVLGNATADEIAVYLNLPNTSTRPRCTGLSRRGVIEDTGERRACGIHQRSIVWKIARDPGEGAETVRDGQHTTSAPQF